MPPTLSCYTAAVEEGLRGCGTVMLESNYDDGMILASDYPYYLKRRIQSNNGHLSNNDCSAVLPQLAASGTKQFVLGHLSQNNNMGLLAHQASEQALLQSGLSRGIPPCRWHSAASPHRSFYKLKAGRNQSGSCPLLYGD